MLHLNHLPNEVPAEECRKVLRRHPITILGTIVGFGLLLSMPFAVEFYFTMIKPEIGFDPVYQPLLILMTSLVFLVCWVMLFLSYLDYYLDVWIVTTKRILNIEQTGLFARVVSEIRLHRVQDVTSSVKGFWATMFDYGQLDVQTAGEKLIISFEQIPHPTEVSKMVLELSEVDRRNQLDDAVAEFNPPSSHKPTATV